MAKYKIGGMITTEDTNFMFIRWIYNIDEHNYYYTFNGCGRSFGNFNSLNHDQEHYTDIFQEPLGDIFRELSIVDKINNNLRKK